MFLSCPWKWEEVGNKQNNKNRRQKVVSEGSHIKLCQLFYILYQHISGRCLLGGFESRGVNFNRIDVRGGSGVVGYC